MTSRSSHTVVVLSVLLAAACGGESQVEAREDVESQGEFLAPISIEERIQAVRLTANDEENACGEIRPFYWEMGSQSEKLVGGSVTREGDPLTYSASTRINLGSASKWIYAAYVAQLREGELEAADIDALSLRSGYTNMADCYPYQTVRGCFAYGDNELYVPEDDGKFVYDGGHMQAHAVSLGLGPLDRKEFAAEVKSLLGEQLPVGFSLAMPSGGANATASGVAAFLRKMMNGQLVLGGMLGTNAVCASPSACPDIALRSPAPEDEVWHYSLGHWVEDDPSQGDGAFSSPGTLGYYPWIAPDKRTYGLIARDAGPSNWAASSRCGRILRQAWRTGSAVEGSARLSEKGVTSSQELTGLSIASAETLAEIQVSSAPIVDFEFDWGRDGVDCPTCNFGDGNNRLVYSDRDYNMWLAHVDPATGEFVPTDGHGTLVDTRAAFATDFGNGPEWMFGASGSQIVYTKYFPGRVPSTFSASVAIAKMTDVGTWDAGIVDGGLKMQSPSGTLDLDDPSPRINYQNFAKTKVYWRVADDPSTETLMPISEQTGGGSRRWVPGTRQVIFSGSAAPDQNGIVYQQVFLYDTDTGEMEQLTFEPVTKWGAFMWRAPEFGNENVFFTVSGRTSLVIYRKLPGADGILRWTVVNTIAMPSQIPYIWSPEPFLYKGRSFIFFQLSSSSQANDMSVPTQLAMTGVEPSLPSLRMLTNDNARRRVRMDPEHYITAQGPFIYYNRYIPSTASDPVRNDGVWRVDTRLGPP
jgi:hypothetical protein